MTRTPEEIAETIADVAHDSEWRCKDPSKLRAAIAAALAAERERAEGWKALAIVTTQLVEDLQMATDEEREFSWSDVREAEARLGSLGEIE